MPMSVSHQTVRNSNEIKSNSFTLVHSLT